MPEDASLPENSNKATPVAPAPVADSAAPEPMEVDTEVIVNRGENVSGPVPETQPNRNADQQSDPQPAPVQKWSFERIDPVGAAPATEAVNIPAEHGDTHDEDAMQGVQQAAATAEQGGTQELVDLINHIDDAMTNLIETVREMNEQTIQDQQQIEEIRAAANDNDDAGNQDDSDTDGEEGDDVGQDDNQNGNANNVPNTDHFVWVNRGDAVDESPSCKLCMTDPGPADSVYVECGHIWCRECLNQYLAQVFTDRDQFPPRCCRPNGFELGSIQAHLDDEVLIQVMEKWEEWSARDPTYCANIQCRAFVSEDRVEGQWATCLLCKVVTCVECKAKKPLHPAPDQHPEPVDDKENTKLAEKEGWKYCPNKKCNKLVEKIDGCDTMTCKCGQQFCYRCGSSFDGPFPCNCAGQNAWVGPMQQWANGNNGNQDEGRDDEDEDDQEESDSEEDDYEEDEEGNDSEDDEADDAQGPENSGNGDGDGNNADWNLDMPLDAPANA